MIFQMKTFYICHLFLAECRKIDMYILILVGEKLEK